ncbi:MAG: LPP20 family lipoprotein [Candidatus Marinimicrobia bacterium]|nr:LPP20 family lipoprotein [Candidatus Neomarinimicrobiota bacterium]MCF7827721.1 LPP20 family lipoprotein [Candidatus Neomarinimicrobiota bacterium]MCF7881224.1 LPP20 family lipoprotein [Candidatus Neomarinimicrobiota bacterium]
MGKSVRTLVSLLVIVFVFSISLQNCGSSRSGSTEESPMKDVPEWFLVQPEAEDAIYGVGSAKKQNPSLARKSAIARARDDIASQVQTKVSSMLKDFMQESGVGENAQALEFTQSVSKQVVDISLEGSKVKEVYPAKDGTFYALVEYPLESLRQSTLSEAQKQEALYNEFKAQQGFDALKEEINNME